MRVEGIVLLLSGAACSDDTDGMGLREGTGAIQD